MPRLVRNGSSYYIIVPKEYIDFLKWNPDDVSLFMYLDGRKIVYQEDFRNNK